MLPVIIGPTASGKTARAVAAARHLGGEIISADSRQLYRGMDLGTGKDLEEYGDVPYHLIDIASAGERLNLHTYLTEFRKAEVDVRSRGHVPVVCGGTGMYVEAVLNGIELPAVPENSELRESLRGLSLTQLTQMLSEMKTLHNVTDVDTCQRAIRAIEIARYYQDHPSEAKLTEPHRREDAVIILLEIDREARRRRISDRLRARLDAGMVDEVRSLIVDGVNPEDLIYYGLEYKWLTLYVMGKISYGEMFSSLETAIHQFAKRQMTWFRGMERRGFTLHRVPYDIPNEEFIKTLDELCAPLS